MVYTCSKYIRPMYKQLRNNIFVRVWSYSGLLSQIKPNRKVFLRMKWSSKEQSFLERLRVIQCLLSVSFQSMPRMGFHGLLLLSLVSLGHEAFGDKIEGLLDREHPWGQRKTAVETPSSADREDVMTPQKSGSWAPLRWIRSSGTQSQTWVCSHISPLEL